MRRRQTIVSAEDATLFREAIGPVKAFKAAPTPPSAPKPKPRARQRERDEINALHESQSTPFASLVENVGDSLAYRRDGVNQRTWRQLRRGQFSVQDEIDLHHLTALSAENVLREFLIECRLSSHLCVRIIHGKGLHSKSGTPVIKTMVEGALRRRSDVLAYASAPPAMGGTGALLVLLSRRGLNEQAAPASP